MPDRFGADAWLAAKLRARADDQEIRAPLSGAIDDFAFRPSLSFQDFRAWELAQTLLQYIPGSRLFGLPHLFLSQRRRLWAPQKTFARPPDILPRAAVNDMEDTEGLRFTRREEHRSCLADFCDRPGNPFSRFKHRGAFPPQSAHQQQQSSGRRDERKRKLISVSISRRHCSFRTIYRLAYAHYDVAVGWWRYGETASRQRWQYCGAQCSMGFQPASFT
jgi:hypothetical protein